MNINVLQISGMNLNDHSSIKKVLVNVQQYENPVIVVSANKQIQKQLMDSANPASTGDLVSAMKNSLEIENKYSQLVNDFLKENPHQKNKLIRESCNKKLEEKIGKLNKFLIYIEKKGDFSPQMKDAILALGEQTAAFLFAQFGLALNLLTQHIEARKIIKTDAKYGKANPNIFLTLQKCDSLETILESGFTPVIGNNHGEASNRTLTTLNPAGPDTADLIGKAFNTNTIKI